MTDDLLDPDALQGFGASARRAVAVAEVEARALGHDRLGTEHLLLGLLADDQSDAAKVLTDAGATIAAARHKVSEAVGASDGAPIRSSGRLPITPRAARALGRAVRFSHARRAEVVASQHVLLGVLDVEGTAGQVLRGLGLDVDRLRASLDAVPHDDDRAFASGDDVEEEAVRPHCPSCSSEIDGRLVHRVMACTSEDGRQRDAAVFSCGNCGVVLGVSPA